jgi:hypothetical protein
MAPIFGAILSGAFPISGMWMLAGALEIAELAPAACGPRAADQDFHNLRAAE